MMTGKQEQAEEHFHATGPAPHGWPSAEVAQQAERQKQIVQAAERISANLGSGYHGTSGKPSTNRSSQFS